MLGLYVVPGVPNTTLKTQETDQSYGPFKTAYRKNIRMLSQSRYELGLPMHVTDLPLLVFGGDDPKSITTLDEEAFDTSFLVARNLDAWEKCGAVPLQYPNSQVQL
jgi:hypothetical protein